MNLLTIVLLLPAVVLLALAVLMLILFLLGNAMQVDVHFESSDGKWADTERTFKGYGYPTLVRAFEDYKATVKTPVTLVRTTPIEWRRVQLWPTYLRNPKWRVPYAARRIAAAQLLPNSGTMEALDPSAVVEYLDECARHGRQVTLLGILGYVDYHQRVIPTAQEINEALKERATLGVSPVTDTDMDAAYRAYRQGARRASWRKQ